MVLKIQYVDAKSKSEKLSKLKTVSENIYCNIIPTEMSPERIDKVWYDVFGVRTLDMYLCRDIFDCKTILISEFATNGFFWGQKDDEATSDEYRDLYERVNTLANMGALDMVGPKDTWCIGKFQNEWFRGYIEKRLDNEMVQIFFFDYGTTELIPLSDTRAIDEESVWIVPPLAIPFVVKDITLSKLNKFKEFQYAKFNISSLKLIEKNSIFEVDLIDEDGNNLLDILKI